MKFLFFIIFLCSFLKTFSISKGSDTLSMNLCNDSILISINSSDTICFINLINVIKKDSIWLKPLNNIIEFTARYFFDTPYGYPTRKFSSEDQLMISFEKFDCVTFVETVLALANIIKNQKYEFCDFAYELRKIRYRQGKIETFPSRLHYFSDWIYCNEEKKIVEDLSGKIDTVLWKKKINFMTSHKKKYHELYDTSFFNQIKKIEKELSAHKKYYLPKDKFDTYKPQIKTGDILVLTVNTGGLDVSHTGFAVWIDNDLYFLHASKSKHKVVITSKPFKDYIFPNKKVTGILVARPL